MSEIIDMNYQNLANAIIVQACKDYIQDLSFAKNPRKSICRRFKEFFGSNYYYDLTSLDYKYLLTECFDKAEKKIDPKVLKAEKKYWGID